MGGSFRKTYGMFRGDKPRSSTRGNVARRDRIDGRRGFSKRFCGRRIIERFGFTEKRGHSMAVAFPSARLPLLPGFSLVPHYDDHFVLPDLGHNRCADSNW